MSKAVCLHVLVMIACCTTAAVPAEERPGSSYWMVKKLEYSQRLLSGLVQGDYEEIDQCARSMGIITMSAGYMNGRPDYREQVTAFQQASRAIILAAEQKDIEGAAKGFTQLTTSCVSCHKFLRRAQQRPVDRP